MRSGARTDDPIADPGPDPLALWRGIDDAVAREAVRRRRKIAVPALPAPPRQPARAPAVPARALEPA